MDKSIKCHKIVKNACYNISELMVASSNNLFCLIRSWNSKDVQFTIIYDKEKPQVITFEKLKPTNYWCFCLKKVTETIITHFYPLWYVVCLFFRLFIETITYSMWHEDNNRNTLASEWNKDNSMTSQCHWEAKGLHFQIDVEIPFYSFINVFLNDVLIDYFMLFL